MKCDGFAFLHVLWLWCESCGMNLKQLSKRYNSLVKARNSQVSWTISSTLSSVCATRFVAWTHGVTVKTSLILSIDLNLLNLHFWVLYGGCLVCKDLWALWCRLASIVAILSKQGCMCWTVQICMFWILAVDIKGFFLCTGFIYELEKCEIGEIGN